MKSNDLSRKIYLIVHNECWKLWNKTLIDFICEQIFVSNLLNKMCIILHIIVFIHCFYSLEEKNQFSGALLPSFVFLTQIDIYSFFLSRKQILVSSWCPPNFGVWMEQRTKLHPKWLSSPLKTRQDFIKYLSRITTLTPQTKAMVWSFFASSIIFPVFDTLILSIDKAYGLGSSQVDFICVTT